MATRKRDKNPTGAELRRQPAQVRSAHRKARQHSRDSKEQEDLIRQLRDHEHEAEAHNQQLREMQRTLEQSRDRYAELYDFAPVAYLTLDENGKIIEINLTGAALLGVERVRLTGMPLLVFVAGEDRQILLDHMHRCRGEPGLVRTDLRIRARGGEVTPVQLASRRAVGASATAAAFHTAVTDLSDRRRAEREREQLLAQQRTATETSAAKDRFLAMLSHELRTPLTPVLAALTAIELDDIPENLRPTVEMLRRNIQLETQLIDDLLDVTRIQRKRMRVEFQTIDLHAVARDAHAICEQDLLAKRINCSLALEAESRHVRGDPVRLRQVIWNLLKNAIKFTPEGGQIALTTSNDADRWVALSVSDTGIGLEPESLDRVFVPFEQITRDEHRSAGLGLGLTICKAMMDAHHGQIQASSEGLGKGATFEIRLETVAAPPPIAAARRPTRPPVARALRILLVEDHVDTARVMARLLRGAGHDVRVAGSIGSTIRLLREDAERFDVLISDIGLPDGSGLELPGKLRSDPSGRGMRTIALSGFGDDDDLRRSHDAGFQQHLTKPIDFTKLLVVLDELTAPGR